MPYREVDGLHGLTFMSGRSEQNSDCVTKGSKRVLSHETDGTCRSTANSAMKGDYTVRLNKPKRRVYKPTWFGQGMQWNKREDISGQMSCYSDLRLL